MANRASSPEIELEDRRLDSGTIPRIREVTLVIEEWRGVQPGRLAWVFPDLPSAVEAANALRNAVRWVIVSGRTSDVRQARLDGNVLAEST